ncbi:MAG TPA: CvpA family protein [Casimicrobiaceae bacterium]|jgi:membrane protein required for colicin V production|nr:CvpA family protein [Casimicrobiaceae bacterium]
MTTFDWIVVCIVALSTLFAFFRGVIRELVALAAWIAGLVCAIAYTPAFASLLPDVLGEPALRYVIAFTLIVVAALVAGALIAWPLSGIVHAAGLGFVDRFLGSLFGLARGIVLMLAFVFVAGLTSLPRSDWWQRSAFVPPLVAGVHALRPHLPAAIAGRLDYAPRREPPATKAPQQAELHRRGVSD